ncbi:MAG TPA: c-type cytochrome [Burkholderiales bacterium]|nr:c-type cytochrome [Burkholderiales bacterium]
MSQPLLHALLGAALVLGVQSALAQNAPKPPASKTPTVSETRPATTNEPVSTENFHAQCIGCHGIPGYKTAYPEVYHVPKIAGQQPGYLIAALKAYKTGERSHPSMRGIAASMNEDQMKAIAEFYGAPAK